MSVIETTSLDGAMTVINPQHPIMKAWLAYKQTEGYKNTFKWAAIEEHRDGSLWAAFLEGYQSAVEQNKE